MYNYDFFKKPWLEYCFDSFNDSFNNIFVENASRVGLRIDISKTKSMNIDGNKTCSYVKIDDTNIENVSQFTSS